MLRRQKLANLPEERWSVWSVWQQWDKDFADSARDNRDGKGRAVEEKWPCCRLRQLQVSLFQRFGLLAQAEREWRLALECKPLGRPLDAQLRINYQVIPRYPTLDGGASERARLVIV